MRPRLFLVLVGMVLAARPGWAGEGIVALQTADASCRTTKTPPPRYVDCGNGTVTDNKTGLVWLKNAGCGGGVLDFHLATEFAAGLSDLPSTFFEPDADCGLSDHSSPGEWRLPSVSEWQTMVEDAVTLGCVPSGAGGPAITNDAGTACWQAFDAGSSFSGVQNSGYWSASPGVFGGWEAYVVYLDFGGAADDESKSVAYRVWPVRGGQ